VAESGIHYPLLVTFQKPADDMDVLDLEARIKQLPGVLGCVIVSDKNGRPSEIQAFSHAGADRAGIRHSIRSEAQALDLAGSLTQVLVFELATESISGDHYALREAELLAELEALGDDESRDEGPEPQAPLAGPRDSERPVIRSVAPPTTDHPEAEVALRGRAGEVVGQAPAGESPRNFRVLAEATLDAVHKLLGEDGVFTPVDTWLSEAKGRRVMIAVVDSKGGELVGAALVRSGPLADAAVRATLAAVNRRLARLS
jgi:hypothetical protein